MVAFVLCAVLGNNTNRAMCCYGSGRVAEAAAVGRCPGLLLPQRLRSFDGGRSDHAGGVWTIGQCVPALALPVNFRPKGQGGVCRVNLCWPRVCLEYTQRRREKGSRGRDKRLSNLYGRATHVLKHTIP